MPCSYTFDLRRLLAGGPSSSPTVCSRIKLVAPEVNFVPATSPSTSPAWIRPFGSNTLSAVLSIDSADSHYNLARAYKAAGRNDQAREEAVLSLEAAPNFKPAQKLLLELSGKE